MPNTLIAAITLGSNSFNMLVAEENNLQPQIIAKYKRKVRLAKGMDEQGNLTPNAIKKGVNCIRMFVEQIKKHAIADGNIKVVATAALREAKNATVFTKQAESLLNCSVEIISGEREAEFIYQGMIGSSDIKGKSLVIDIGGASTEFIIGDDNAILFKASLGLGCVVLTQKYFLKTPFKPASFEAIAFEVKAALAPYVESMQKLKWDNVVGASGIIQTLVEIQSHRNLPHFIDRQMLANFQQEILLQTEVNLASISGILPERAPTFAAGVGILLAIFELLDIEQLCLSGGALREGVLLDMTQKESRN